MGRWIDGCMHCASPVPVLAQSSTVYPVTHIVWCCRGLDRLHGSHHALEEVGPLWLAEGVCVFLGDYLHAQEKDSADVTTRLRLRRR